MTATPGLQNLRRWRAQAAEVTGMGLDEAEALEQVRALEELKAAAAAAQARLTAHAYAARAGREAAEGVPAGRRCAGLGAEVALARRVSPHQGNRHLGVALALTREMPHTLAALASGALSEWRATLLVRETTVLTEAHRAEVDRQLAPHLSGTSGWGDRRLGNEARRIGYRLDPGSALRRVRGAHTDRRVSVRPAPDTMAYLTGFLPVAQGVACQAALSREADTLKAAGDSRTRGQIMADTLVQRLTGQSIASGVPVEVELVMTDRTLLEGSGEPAQLVGYGPVPAETARALVRTSPHAWVRRLFTHPDSGALVAMDSRRRRFAGQLRHQLVLTNDTCATPWCDAPVRHADHTTPARAGGQTTCTNGTGLCETCNYTKELPGWDASLVTRSDGTRILHLTSPTRRHHSRDPDPPGAPDPGTRVLGRIDAA
ncbi:MAG TPA: DUF222 domain-containing protein [Marmoricola sp.]|nr:DUF222 domain-containing protein [Marmoricola sp.]